MLLYNVLLYSIQKELYHCSMVFKRTYRFNVSIEFSILNA